METKNKTLAEVNGTQIVITRVVNAPRELVFEAWTSAAHLDRWFGPAGFKTETESFEFKVGGSWRFTMTHPEYGTFPEHIRWDEITAPERLRYAHVDSFDSIVTFYESDGQTTVRMCNIFPSEEVVKEVIEKYHAIEGGKQTLGKMSDYVEEHLK